MADDHDHEAAVASFGCCPHCETLLGVPGPPPLEPEPEPEAEPEQLTVEEIRAEAIGRADVHADVEWKPAALASLHACAERLEEFTADDVWDLLEAEHPDARTHEPAALGPVFLDAARRGWIAKKGEAVLSRYGRRHRDLTVWRSLIGES